MAYSYYSYDRRTAATPDLHQLLDTLKDLRELDENLDEIETTFSMHFHTASTTTASALDPEVKSQFATLQKALEGLRVAKELQKAADQMVKLHPEDKIALRAKKDGDTMVARFEKHAEAARKIIRTISSKQMPADLKKLGNAAAKIIKDRLVDDSTLQVIPWADPVMRDAVYQIVLRVNVPTEFRHEGRVEVRLEVDTGRPGGPVLVTQFAQITRDPTPKVIAEGLFKQLVGWPGLKGESEATEARKAYADRIAAAMQNAASRLSRGDVGRIEKSNDLRTIEIDYRSDLPKEGAYSVGEYEYDRMVEQEISQARKAYESALAPFKDKIEKIEIHAGEKGWIYATAHLK